MSLTLTPQSHEEEPIYSTEHKTGEDEEVGEESEIPSETFDDDLEEEQEDTEVPADDDDDEEDFRSELVQQEEEHGRVLEALRSSHARQLEVYQEQNTLLTAQIHTLNQQLLQVCASSCGSTSCSCLSLSFSCVHGPSASTVDMKVNMKWKFTAS